MRIMCARVAVVAGMTAIGAAALIAQSGPTPIGLSDLLNGGWGNSKYYQPKQGDLDKAKLQQEKDEFDKKMEDAKKQAEAAKDLAEKGKDLKDLYEKYADYKELMEDYDTLTPEDGPFDPDYTPPGAPQVPTSCAAGSKECGPCFEDAYGQLNAVRVRFEKLRVVYGSTKSWVNRALSFGDNAASIHGLAGLAWQTERRKIEASVANLDRSYDDKYAELMGVLETSMHAIEICEAKFYNNPDWYNRFGFVYYSFMADRYRR